MKIRFGGVSAGIAVVAAIAAFAAPGMHGQLWAKTAGTGQSNAWQAVIAADKAEISALNAVTAAAMKKGDPNAVVTAQQLINTVRARLAREEAMPSFLPYFDTLTNPAVLPQPEETLELARDQTVAGALISEDEKNIVNLKASVASDMKAGKAQLVVNDMSALKQAQVQLAQDKSAAAMLVRQPAGAGVFNQPGSFFRPGGFPAGAQIPASQGQFQFAGSSVGTAIPVDRWRGLVAAAMKPVGWSAVPSLAEELSRFASNPGKLIGMKVLAYGEANTLGEAIIRGSRGRPAELSAANRIKVQRLRHQLAAQFDAICQRAHADEKQEYQAALEQQEVPGAVMATVPFAQQRREQLRCSAVTIPARRAERKDLRDIGTALRPPHNRLELLSVSGRRLPSTGAVYGVIVGINAVDLPIVIPSFRYSNSQSWAAFPFPHPGVSADGFTLDCTHKVYQVKLLYCAKSPNYITIATHKALGPIKGYVFHLKNGNTVQATSYTTGTDYYHTVWDGIGIPVAKNLVVKISVIRK